MDRLVDILYLLIDFIDYCKAEHKNKMSCQIEMKRQLEEYLNV